MGSSRKRKPSESEKTSSSSDSEEKSKKKRRKKEKRKGKKHTHVSSSDSSSSTEVSSDSSSSSEEERKRKRKKEKKKKKKSKLKSKHKNSKKDIGNEKDKKDTNECCTDVPLELMDRGKALAPMTKEQWEKQQSVVRRVYDESTGRHRLIKGDGEVIEEIVSKDRHKAINKQATSGDGDYFHKTLYSNLTKK